MLSAPNVLYFLANELAGLSRGRFAGASGPMDTTDRLSFGHRLTSCASLCADTGSCNKHTFREVGRA
jgi:hypothetical protein